MVFPSSRKTKTPNSLNRSNYCQNSFVIKILEVVSQSFTFKNQQWIVEQIQIKTLITKQIQVLM